jgi:uncharacterized protein YlxW (UPF0749 family)
MLHAMAARRQQSDTGDATSRKRTADLLRKLRQLKKETKMLRATIESAQQEDTARGLLGGSRRRRR